MPLWKQLSDYHLAHRGRFLTSDVNKGHKRNTKQINNTSRLASRTQTSGMMAGITSPARPWFRLATPDTALMEVMAVKTWLHDVEALMREIFNQSNAYNVLSATYAELGVFGVAAFGVFEDYDNVIRCQPYTVGSYMLGINGRQEVDTLYREYKRSVGQVVKEFGYEQCSQSVQSQWDNGNSENWVEILHCIEPNDDRDHMNPTAANKKYRSVYLEVGANQDKFLKESGFDEFPIMAPRWEVTGDDVYATSCPGIDSIGDAKGLQLLEKRKFQAIDKQVDPPLQGPSSLRNHVDNGGLLPGDKIFVDDMNAGGFKSIYDVNLSISELKEEITRTENRISRTFYEDLFLMLVNSDRRQITAREIEEKHEEKLLMLGPVLERLHNELLDPLIDRTFNIMARAGILPPPPPELENADLRVEYISTLAQAQRLTAIGGIERLGGFVMSMAEIYPEVRHKYDPLQAVDEYAEALGTSPRLVVPDDVVEEKMAAEAQQQQMAAANEMAATAAETAKTTSEIDNSEGGSMAQLMERMGLA